MKKFAIFCAVAVALSSISVGCTSDGSSSFCRSGSLWPTARSRQQHETVYASSGMTGSCTEVDVCGPCEPICEPCGITCSGDVYNTGTIQLPGVGQ